MTYICGRKAGICGQSLGVQPVSSTVEETIVSNEMPFFCPRIQDSVKYYLRTNCCIPSEMPW